MKLQVMIIVRIAKRALATVPYGGCIELLLFMSTCASCRKNSKVSSFYVTVKIVTALNVSSSAHNCGCVVDGGNAMAAI